MNRTYLREAEVVYKYKVRDLKPIRLAQDAAAMLTEILKPDQSPRESFVCLWLNARHRCIGWEIVSKGTANASLIHPRELFQGALIAGACAIIIGHNHPSGDPEPSAEDRAVTSRIKQAGELLEVTLLDSIVVGFDGAFLSLKESGLM